MSNQLKNHLKNFTVKELKKEILNVKRDFQVSKLKRVDVEKVILKNHQHFLHLLEKNKVKKTRASTKKPKPSMKKSNPTVKDINTNRQQYDMQVKEYITKLLDKLDEIAVGQRNPVFIDEKYSGVIIQKGKSRYIIRNQSNEVLLTTLDRKQVEELLYYMIK